MHPSAADMTCFFVAYVDGEPVACGGMRAIDAEHGEIKRMYVVPERRGSGRRARASCEVLEDDARARGWTRVVLETGTEPARGGAALRARGLLVDPAVRRLHRRTDLALLREGAEIASSPALLHRI